MIDELRKSIDEIDEEILKLLLKRKDLAREIGKLKENLDKPIYDKKREEEILNKISQKAKRLGLNTEFIDRIFSAIFQSSRSAQQEKFGNVNCDIKKIGLIGFGRFGQLVVKHLSKDFRFYVYDKLNKKIRREKAIHSPLKEACQNEIVVLAVPISEIEGILKRIKNLLKKDSLVIDVCSVKEYPIKLMKSILPKNVQILATHPMFGPDSASDSLLGRKITLCKVRSNKELYNQIKRFFESKGLVVVETTPENHDREIAKSLVLTHFIGRALIDSKASNLDIDTEDYKRLLKILDTVKNDTWQLFEDMNNYNKFSKKIRKDFIMSLNKIDSKLK